MFTKTEGHSGAIDSVTCVGASIKKRDVWAQEAPVVTLNMVYANREKHITFGTCPVQESLLSEKTLDALKVFIESAEVDFGNLVFGSGALNLSDREAESKEGLHKKGLGE